MNANGQLQPQLLYPQTKKPLIPTEQEAGQNDSWSGCFREDKNI